jgi:hypothetical protein
MTVARGLYKNRQCVVATKLLLAARRLDLDKVCDRGFLPVTCHFKSSWLVVLDICCMDRVADTPLRLLEQSFLQNHQYMANPSSSRTHTSVGLRNQAIFDKELMQTPTISQTYRADGWYTI